MRARGGVTRLGWGHQEGPTPRLGTGGDPSCGGGTRRTQAGGAAEGKRRAPCPGGRMGRGSSTLQPGAPNPQRCLEEGGTGHDTQGCHRLTQWSSQMPVTTAGPSERAGFMLPPENGPWGQGVRAGHGAGSPTAGVGAHGGGPYRSQGASSHSTAQGQPGGAGCPVGGGEGGERQLEGGEGLPAPRLPYRPCRAHLRPQPGLSACRHRDGDTHGDGGRSPW